MMSKSLFGVFLALVCVSNFALAADSAFRPNIYTGNWMVGGEASFNHSPSLSASSQPAENDFSISVPIQYFLMDRLAVGGDISYSLFSTGDLNSVPGSTINTLGLGPAATYFFWTQDHLAAYVGVGGDVSFNDSDHLGNWTLYGKLGINYFFTPSVALGPYFEITHYFGSEVPVQTPFAFAANFSVFL